MSSEAVGLLLFGICLLALLRPSQNQPSFQEQTREEIIRALADEQTGEPEDGNMAIVIVHGVPHYPKHNMEDQENYNEDNEDTESDDVGSMDNNDDDDDDDDASMAGSGKEEADHGLDRGHIQKRYTTANDWRRWGKGIVPYTFRDTVDSGLKAEIHASMYEIEKHTCIQFVPWVFNETKENYELEDESHVRFNRGNGCASIQGNRHWKNGQGNSCCSRKYCLHELGHSLGFSHEQNNPLRHGWMRFNYQNMEKEKWKMGKISDPQTALLYRYDVTSKMHYGRGGSFEAPFMSMQFKELQALFRHRENTYYFYMDIARSYKCKEQNCSSFDIDCVNDGFVSLVDGKCACMCPPGLEPDTGCATVRKNINRVQKWPRGSYGMLSPQEGCPGSNEFQEGSRTHYSDGNSRTSAHLHLRGVFTKTKFNYTFCVKEESVNSGGDSAEWGRGRYCIFRKNQSCPEGFQDGHIQFDDKVQSENVENTVTGVLPDGDFGNDTLFQFCCRDDGFYNTPLHLPNNKPFILFNKHSHACQKVDGMYAKQEVLSFDVDDTSGLSERNGSVPSSRILTDTVNLRFCYYTPLKTDCGGVIDLTRDSPTDNFTSPNYPNVYDNTMECVWLIKGPVGSNILLHFDEFNIERRNKISCKDSLSIRYALLGQNTFQYCGDGDDSTYRSVENLMTLILQTDLSGQRKGFKASVKLVLPENHCFNQQDKGLSYRGNVSFTRDYQTCLPWNMVTNCTNHLFKSTDFDDGLEENYCRNPDNTFRPWCFTSIKNNQCLRNYCDVCLLESRYDAREDCEKKKRAGQCPVDDAEAIADCAKTCSPVFPTVKVQDCGRPNSPSDAEPMMNLNDSYNIGDTVSFKCRTGNEVLTQRCLSDGTWSPGEYVCGACTTGWAAFNGSCYKYSDTTETYADAEGICKSMNATVATSKSEAELGFVSSLGFVTWSMWLGATDSEKEGTFIWSDGTPVTWANWDKGKPSRRGAGKDCAIIFGEHKGSVWSDISCTRKFRFVCKMTPSARVLCTDRLLDCEVITANNTVCSENPDFAWQQCPKTCGICH